MSEDSVTRTKDLHAARTLELKMEYTKDMFIDTSLPKKTETNLL